MGQDQLLHLIRAMEQKVDQSVSDADYRSVTLPCEPFPGDRDIEPAPEPQSERHDSLENSKYSETKIYLHLSKAV